VVKKMLSENKTEKMLMEYSRRLYCWFLCLLIRSRQKEVLIGVDDGESVRSTFLQNLRKKWNLLWSKQVGGNIQSDRVALQTYPLILLEHNGVVCAATESKVQSFSDILDYWATLSLLYTSNRSSDR